MAKKKTEAPAAKAKKPAGNAAGSPAGVPSIDTDLVAAAAAKALSAGVSSASAGSSAPASKESTGFKQLKAGLNKPAFGNSSNNLLGNLGGSKKTNQPFGGGKQVGRNQTFGADVNRAGVPRRTGGG